MPGVLAVLRAAEGPLTLTEVAIESTRRADDATDGFERENLDRVCLTLHHRHLPKLADAGCVEYDAAEKTVALSGTTREAAASEAAGLAPEREIE